MKFSKNAILYNLVEWYEIELFFQSLEENELRFGTFATTTALSRGNMVN